METKTIFAFDKQGYFVEEVLFQIAPGIYLPDDATETPLPEANRQDNFFQWDGEKWSVIPKPTTAAELVGVTIAHDSQTIHDLELRNRMIALCTADSGYRVERGADLSWTVAKIPDPTLEELKAAKKSELDAAFLQWYQQDAIVTSSLGFIADSDERAVTDVSGLIKVSEATGEGTIFMDADNQPHPLTLEELKLLQLEILQNGQFAYKQKWQIRDAIDAAADAEALEAIEINFVGLDFTKEAKQ